ncbi:nucleotidyltransferase [Pontibacillus sp. ALD_SL1]|uniref:SMODS domain-containing nucleotidyltransferase n=1 Tax=Pontibacillus sp. ALD_SL1 TaxID=2777185 RepID=UPI001A95CBD2|nr:nucleotidyltransferase [Pontibacillus sp. ALD_SL1]QSS98752.1 nucleotidyltransferase [Pontibacillus sp. ALD_SL1]
MGTADYFFQFCKSIRMNDDVVRDITYRTNRITKQLNKDFWDSESSTAHSFYSGSYGRGTDIFVSDIDLLMQLPYEFYKKYNNYVGNGQSSLLQEVKNSIEKTYKSYKRADGQVVKVDFTDGVSYEIVPCFINKDGESYTYPDTNNGGKWKVTNPKPEIKELNITNHLTNKNLKRLCRMARAWKVKWTVPISGFLIDTLAYQFLRNWKFKDKSYVYYDWMVRDFFKFLMNQDENKSFWLAPGSNQRVYRTGKFEYKAKRCYNISLEAIDKEVNGYGRTAKSRWREIFGTKFPS